MDAPPQHFGNFDAYLVAGNHIAHGRHPAQLGINIAADGMHVRVVQGQAHRAGDSFHGNRGVDHPGAVGGKDWNVVLVVIGELVLNLADDFFQHVLQGHHALYAAVLVNDDGHLQRLGAHQPKQVVHGHILGDELRFAHQGFQPDAGLAIGKGVQNVAHMQDADDVVHSVLIDRQAGVPGGDEHIDDFSEGGGQGSGVNVQPRHHNVRHVAVVHAADGAHHVDVVVVQVQDFGGGKRGNVRVGVAVGLARAVGAVGSRRIRNGRCGCGTGKSVERLGQPTGPIGENGGAIGGQKVDDDQSDGGNSHGHRQQQSDGPSGSQRDANQNGGNAGGGRGHGAQDADAGRGGIVQKRNKGWPAPASGGGDAGPSENQQRGGQEQ